MFARADQLLVERLQDKFPLHAVDFHWEGFEPHLVCFDLREKKISEFDLHDVRFAASKKKTCVGQWDGDEYVPCPKQIPVSRFDQCQECAGESFIPYQDCIFEPRCDGELCDLDFCRREHVLYVAFYDTRMKLGMSSTRRVDRRLVEQGADAYCVIGKFPTRKRARDAEKAISLRLRIPQAHRQEHLLRGLARPVDSEGIRKRHEALAVTLEEAFHLRPEPVTWLDGYPIELPLREVPRLEEAWGRHDGEVVGVKGRWIIFESSGLKALNLPDLTARFLDRRSL